MAPPKWLAVAAACKSFNDLTRLDAALTDARVAIAAERTKLERLVGSELPQPQLLAAASNVLRLATTADLKSVHISALHNGVCIAMLANSSIAAGASPSAQLQGEEAWPAGQHADHDVKAWCVRRLLIAVASVWRRCIGALHPAHACVPALAHLNRHRLRMLLGLPARAGLFVAAATAAHVVAAALSAMVVETQQTHLLLVTRVHRRPCATCAPRTICESYAEVNECTHDHNASQQHSTTQQHQPAAGSARCTCLNTAAACVTAVRMFGGRSCRRSQPASSACSCIMYAMLSAALWSRCTTAHLPAPVEELTPLQASKVCA
jgi:hypothetical protein